MVQRARPWKTGRNGNVKFHKEKVQIRQVFDTLFGRYGPQHWWPARTAFEVCVGAILTQNTTWINVEKALKNLRAAGLLSFKNMVSIKPDKLAAFIKPSGYFNQKARKLKVFCDFLSNHGGSVSRLSKHAVRNFETVRGWLLDLWGIGPETADSILLYALGVPVFVVDAYTRRIGTRLAWLKGDEPYDAIQLMFSKALDRDAILFNEYHALLVHHGKSVCTASNMSCETCCLFGMCPASRADNSSYIDGR